jgi:hypothetical protein
VGIDHSYNYNSTRVQEALRALLSRLTATTEALTRDPSNPRLTASLRATWHTFTTINTFYAAIKRDICLPQIGTFFPGAQDEALANNDRMEAEQTALEPLIAAGPKPDAVALSAAVTAFDVLARATYEHVEDHIRPIVRRYIPGPVQKKIMVDCWDDAPPEGWFHVIPAVVQALPMQGQRVTYIRAFLWAMPERCQQIGTMVAVGTDPVTWYRLRRAVPEIVPRGEAGWKRY